MEPLYSGDPEADDDARCAAANAAKADPLLRHPLSGEDPFIEWANAQDNDEEDEEDEEEDYATMDMENYTGPMHCSVAS